MLHQKITVRINTLFIRKLMTDSWPLFLGLICTTAYSQVDLVLIKTFRGAAEGGLYQAAYKLLFGFQLIGVVHTAMFPRLAHLYAENNSAGYRKVMRMAILSSLMFLIPIAIATHLFPADIIRLVFGRQYVGAADALPILIWSGMFAYINGFFAYTLIISGQQRLWLISVSCALATLVVMEITLIPRIGYIGAAIASFAGELIDLLIVIAAVSSSSKLRGLFILPENKGSR
jgi:O-antigen/teichoic acid export membrane protein